MNANLINITKYIDFLFAEAKRRNRKTTYEVNVIKRNNSITLYLDPKITKEITIVDEAYITPLNAKGYALLSREALDDNSIKLAFYKDTGISLDESAIMHFLDVANIDTTNLSLHTFKNVSFFASCIVIPL